MKILSTGNEEIDSNLGGGLPVPSLMLIEGDHGSGKTAIIALLMKGMLDGEMRVLYFTENTVTDYIKKMKSITFDFTVPFLKDKMKILSMHVDGTTWSKHQSSTLLSKVGQYIAVNDKKIDCVAIDSLSLLTLYASQESIMDFITKCRNLVSQGMTIILTIQPNSIPQELNSSLKSASDVYLALSSSNIGSQAVKVMKTVKMIGSKALAESSFAFNVDPIFGIKSVPISMATV